MTSTDRATRTEGDAELHSGLSAIRGVYMGREAYPHAITIGHRLIALVHRVGEPPPVPGDETAANAERIVTMWNSHDALLAAACELENRCTDCGDDEKWHNGDHGQCSLCDYECRNFHAFTKLRAAIALATV